jgi:hypothetical protein
LPQNITAIAVSVKIKDNIIYTSSIAACIGNVRPYNMVGFGRQIPQEKE